MMARRGVLGLMAGGIVAALSGCGSLIPNSYRFKMRVEIETPLGLRTGTSIYEVRAGNTPKLLPEEAARDWTIAGEAVAVDLSEGRALFALLKTVNPIRPDLALMSMAALDPAFENDIVKSAARISSGEGIRSPAEVSPSDYPLLVSFRDLKDPKSVERVDPKNLAQSFGFGSIFRRITVEVTSEAVTTGLEDTLSWLDSGLPRLPISKYPPAGIELPLFATLTKMDFVQGKS